MEVTTKMDWNTFVGRGKLKGRLTEWLLKKEIRDYKDLKSWCAQWDVVPPLERHVKEFLTKRAAKPAPKVETVSEPTESALEEIPELTEEDFKKAKKKSKKQRSKKETDSNN